ncbi:MAG: 50S ribosomal protein L24 [Clostridiales bacterium]|jgi:large subunit ribosomal protein L24|nr:50S ribosomal protein L24 [Clostridiales bacterium]
MGVVTKQNVRPKIKTRLKRGDRVVVIAGKDKGKSGKIMVIDRQKARIIVENVNMAVKHRKARKQDEQGGIIKFEAPVAISNVMYQHKGKPTRLGVKLEQKEVNGKTVTIKTRIARTTGEAVD